MESENLLFKPKYTSMWNKDRPYLQTMEKIAARVAEGVSFEFRYNVNHELQKITIPAYSTVDTSLDWYGYAKMAELYGMN